MISSSPGLRRYVVIPLKTKEDPDHIISAPKVWRQVYPDTILEETWVSPACQPNYYILQLSRSFETRPPSSINLLPDVGNTSRRRRLRLGSAFSRSCSAVSFWSTISSQNHCAPSLLTRQHGRSLGLACGGPTNAAFSDLPLNFKAP